MSLESMTVFFEQITQNGENIKDLYQKIKETSLNIRKKLAEEEEARRAAAETASSATNTSISNNNSR